MKGQNKIWAGVNIQQVILKHHVEATVIFYVMYVRPFVAFWQDRDKTYIWKKSWRKIKVNLGWWHFLCNMRNSILVLCKICYLRKWRKNSSSDVVLYRYSFKTQTIGFEMIRVRGFWGKFYPKIFKETNRARLKNMFVCHYPGLFLRVHSAGRIFFLSFWDGKESINPYYL